MLNIAMNAVGKPELVTNFNKQAAAHTFAKDDIKQVKGEALGVEEG